MFRIEHRDMSPAERRIVESEAEAARRERSGGSSRPVAVGLLILGSFFVGLVFFGLPFSTIVDPRDRDLAIFGPALASMLVGGTWSTIYFLRGRSRWSLPLYEDLEYGRVEVIEGRVSEAWIVQDTRGFTWWLLEVDEWVLVVGPPASGAVPARTLPGRDVNLVRCKHSGLVLGFTTHGARLAPRSRLLGSERPLGIPSARFEGALEDVLETRLDLAA